MVQSSGRQFALLGPPGSGKGTQAKALAGRLGVPHVSTGDIFREQVARQTPLGVAVDSLLRQGQLVPDEVTNKIVAERLRQTDAVAGFVLDGYPRNLAQAEFLSGFAPQVRAVQLELPDNEAVRRITRRWTCSVCGAVYHLDFKPPKQAGVCDTCGGKLAQRNDQREAVVRERLSIYHREVEPLVNYYQERGLLTNLDSRPPIAEVTLSMWRVLNL